MSDLSPANPLLKKLTSLRIELIDLAFDLDRRARPDAADVAMTISARLAELCEEFNGRDLVAPAEAMRSRT